MGLLKKAFNDNLRLNAAVTVSLRTGFVLEPRSLFAGSKTGFFSSPNIFISSPDDLFSLSFNYKANPSL
jgi:hypothetical protein